MSTVNGFDIDFRNGTPSADVFALLRVLRNAKWVEEQCPSQHAWHFIVHEQQAVTLLRAAGLEIS